MPKDRRKRSHGRARRQEATGAEPGGSRWLNAATRIAAWILAVYVVVHTVAVDPAPLFGAEETASFFALPKFVVAVAGAGLAASIAICIEVLGGGRYLGALMQAPRPSWLVLTGLAALAAVLLSPLIATETPARIGVVGFGFRYDGALLLAACLVLAGASAALSYHRPRAESLGVGAYVGAAAIAGGFAVAQSFGVDIWRWLGVPQLGVRARSTLGNPAFVSVFTATAAILLANMAIYRGVWARARVLVPVLAAVGLLTYAAWRIASEAALVGLVVVAVAWSTAWIARVLPATGRKWAAGAAIALVLAAGFAAFLSPGVRGRAGSLASNVVEQAGEHSWGLRRVFMGVAMRAIGEQPLRPYGVGSFTIVVWEAANEAQTRALYEAAVPKSVIDDVRRRQNVLIYDDPNDGVERRERVIHDKVHNYVLDLWIAFGAIPTILLLVFVGGVVVRLLQAATPITWGVAAAAAVYAIWGLAWFPSVALEPLVFTLLGLGWGSAERTLRDPSDADVPA